MFEEKGDIKNCIEINARGNQHANYYLELLVCLRNTHYYFNAIEINYEDLNTVVDGNNEINSINRRNREHSTAT